MKPYPKYKPTNNEWIGEIPSHWQNKSLKYIISINDETLSENQNEEFEINYVEISDVNSTEGIKNFSKLKFIEAPSRARRVVKNGDVIVSTVRTYLKAIAKVNQNIENLIVSTGFAVLRAKYINSDFLGYFVLSNFFIDFTISNSYGVSYPAINSSEIGDIKAFIPPLPEQLAIVTYLDQKTTLIDELIAKKERKIELLKENRIALITHAVTKGLDPTVKYKDSSIEWIGEIPEQWKMLPIKFLGKKGKDSIVDGPFGSSINVEEDYGDFEIPVIRTLNISDFSFKSESLKFMKREKYNNLKRHNVIPDDILFSKVGTIGNVCIFPNIFNEGILSTTGSCRIRLEETEFLNYWLVYLLFSYKEHFKFLSGQNVQPFLNMTTIKDVRIPVPSFFEQHQIVDYLDTQTALIDQNINLELQKIEKLKEYRQSLISNVVTGKICVLED